jgi:hypothetical protein
MMRCGLYHLVLSTLPMMLVAHSLAAAPRGGEAVELASGKSALVEIVIPDKAGPAEQYAARELSDYLHRICGTRLSVIPESQTSQRPRFFVGRTRAAATVLADLRGADMDAFAVRRTGRVNLLVGVNYAEQSRSVYDLTQEAARKRDRQLLDQAVKLAQQSEAQFRAAAKAAPEYVDLDLPPMPLNRFLSSAQATVGAPAKKGESLPLPDAGGAK